MAVLKPPPLRLPTRRCGYEYISEIGRGTYGNVYLVRGRDGKEYAAKEILIKNKESPVVDPVEIDVSFRLRHPNLNCAYALLVPSEECPVEALGLVSPLADTNLSDYLLQNEVSFEKKRQILYEVTSGIQFLHDNNVLHLDIKTDNVLIKDDRAIVTDFGLSRYVDDVEKGLSILHDVITVTYRPPEVFLGYYVYNVKSDMWSLGILFLYTFSSLTEIYDVRGPEDYANDVIFKQIDERLADDTRLQWIEAYLEPHVPLHSLHDIATLISTMLSWDPDDRPSLHQVLSSPIFNMDPIRGRVNEVDQVNISDLTYIKRIVIRKGIKRLIQMSRLISYLPVSVLFLGVDLYYRGLIRLRPFLAGPFRRDVEDVTLVAAAALLLASKIYDDNVDDVITAYLNEYLTLVPKENLYTMETQLVTWCDGILCRKYLFGGGLGHLVKAYPLLWRVHDYLLIDIPEWIRITPTNDYQDKNISIENYFDLIDT